MSSEFIFDIVPAEKPFVIRNAKTGQVKRYILREAGEGATAKYQARLTRGMKFDENGKPTSAGEDVHEAPALLVSLCTFVAESQNPEAPDDDTAIKMQGSGKDALPVGVGLETVKAWPHRVIKRLYEWLEEQSDIGQQETAGALLTQRAEIDRKLAALEANGTAEDRAKNSPSATADTSA